MTQLLFDNFLFSNARQCSSSIRRYKCTIEKLVIIYIWTYKKLMVAPPLLGKFACLAPKCAFEMCSIDFSFDENHAFDQLFDQLSNNLLKDVAMTKNEITMILGNIDVQKQVVISSKLSRQLMMTNPHTCNMVIAILLSKKPVIKLFL